VVTVGGLTGSAHSASPQGLRVPIDTVRRGSSRGRTSPGAPAMRSPDVTLRHATEDDEPGLLALVRACFGADNRLADPAFWRWKHQANPFGRSALLVAEHGDRIVGLRTFLRWAWASRSLVVPAVRAVDTAT